MSKTKIGWVGDYKRNGKQFDLAYLVASKLNAELVVAGPVDSSVYVERGGMPDFYRELDCLLVTSAFEAHPLCVYESLACGTPVLMEQGVGDCWVNNVKGVYYYHGFDVDNICKAVKFVVKNREQFSRDGVRCVKEEWNWGGMKSNYEQLFRGVCDADYPSVLWLIDIADWGWDFMGKDIKQFVWRNIIDMYVNTVRPDVLAKAISSADVVMNHVWNLGNFKIPPHKNVLCVNNPSFLHPSNARMFYDSVNMCGAITTVSLPLMDVLKFMGKPVYYASRGVNAEVFHP